MNDRELEQNIVERGGRGRERLLELEKEGKFVFHGSPTIIDVLEPRQAYKYNKNHERKEDGKPAVFASQYADVAIFRALTSGYNVGGESSSGFGIDDGKLHFSATQNLLDAAKGMVGHVYVLDKDNFSRFVGMQCRSFKKNIPVETIEVTIADLPPNIEIIKI
jgi:hypothetical protein